MLMMVESNLCISDDEPSWRQHKSDEIGRIHHLYDGNIAIFAASGQ